MNFAVVFPGQGSQAVGMLQELAAEHRVVGDTFAEASAVLGYDLWALVQQGPAAALDTTTNTQPALLAADVALWRAWCEAGGPRPAVMAGHSLGEYAALVAADALAFEAGIELAAFRGELMQAAVPAGQGAMAAILGLQAAAVVRACERACQKDTASGGEFVDAANFNAPGQIVIAGHTGAVARAIEIAKAEGAKRAVLLPVSVPSHCRLLIGAAQKLAERLAGVDFTSPRIPVIHNVDAALHRSANEIRAALAAQLHRPVRWVDTVRDMVQKGSTSLVELGPGKVLSGLGKRTERGLPCLPANTAAGFNAALAAVR